MSESAPQLVSSFRRWFHEQREQHGLRLALRNLTALLWEFLRDSVPSRRRQRYGDVDFDWDNRVDTTSATVGWRDRMVGLFNSPYQPTDPALFREMLESLKIDFREFVFVDVGSGKGRVLLIASDYPFRRIVGVELMPELHRIAQENIAKYKSEALKCFALETTCADACEFVFPAEPLVLYLFNPLPEAGLIRVLANVEQSWWGHRRPIFVLYHNPLLEHVLADCRWLRKAGGTNQYVVYSA